MFMQKCSNINAETCPKLHQHLSKTCPAINPEFIKNQQEWVAGPFGRRRSCPSRLQKDPSGVPYMQNVTFLDENGAPRAVLGISEIQERHKNRTYEDELAL